MIILFSLFLNILFVINHDQLANFFKLYDAPDNLRKLHTNKIALTGGILIFLNLILVKIYLLLNIDNINFISVFKNEIDFFIFAIAVILIFLLGFFDDKFEISANLKFIIMLCISSLVIILSDDLLIKTVKLSFLSNNFELSYPISFMWTMICFMLFLNALNMFDGINYQVSLYSIFICSFFILINYFSILFILIMISLIFFIYLNHKNKAFLGDSGSYLLAFLFSYFFVKLYNQTELIFSDQIVLFMLIPGLDLMRLFIIRIYNKRSPFFPDRKHFHHLLMSKYSLKKVNLIIFSLIFIPSSFGYLYGYTYIFLSIQIAIYLILVIKYK